VAIFEHHFCTVLPILIRIRDRGKVHDRKLAQWGQTIVMI